jgi:hypothetical protein
VECSWARRFCQFGKNRQWFVLVGTLFFLLLTSVKLASLVGIPPGL